MMADSGDEGKMALGAVGKRNTVLRKLTSISMMDSHESVSRKNRRSCVCPCRALV